MSQVSDFTIAQAAARIASGDLKPSELVEACLARTTEVESAVRAWAHIDPDTALMAGRLADARPLDHPLYGIPFGVKDIIETLDLPTGYGTPIYHNHRGARDAAPVALLKEAGGIVFAKAVTTELAHFHPGKTRNPHAVGHTPGGSSSGSAAAVAAGMVPFALGTQTTGSVLRPASYCGVYGFKPSFGDVSRSGVFECVSSFDTVGWFTRSVDDTEIVRQGLLRLPVHDLPEVAISNVRIGVFRGSEWDKAEDYTQRLIEGAGPALAAAGAKVSDVAAPAWFSELAELHRRVAGFEFARAITFERVERGHLLSRKLVDGRCADGLALRYDDYVAAQERLAVARHAIAELMASYDVLITPAAPGEAWSRSRCDGRSGLQHRMDSPARAGAKYSGIQVALGIAARFAINWPLPPRCRATRNCKSSLRSPGHHDDCTVPVSVQERGPVTSGGVPSSRIALPRTQWRAALYILLVDDSRQHRSKASRHQEHPIRTSDKMHCLFSVQLIDLRCQWSSGYCRAIDNGCRQPGAFNSRQTGMLHFYSVEQLRSDHL